jgi:secreted PhoX family phosphatase
VKVSRRRFVRSTAVTAAFLGLGRYVGTQTTGGPARGSELQPYLSEVEGYGPLVTDPTQILDLPRGFSYQIVSRAGDRMTDGFNVPALADGMAAFPGPNGRVILVRNHELDEQAPPHLGPFGYELASLSGLDPNSIYDRTTGSRPHFGGTTTVLYNQAAGQVEQQFLSLTGTLRNCAGGATPWGTWISCEESVETAGEINARDHGYAFEVPATATPGLTVPVPLTEMGRFYREAVAVEPRSGVVYQTEDRIDGLLYRFIPNTPGALALGGRLQTLAARDQTSLDTRNYAETGVRVPLGEPMPVRWIDIDNVASPEDDLRVRGAALGAAVFARAEGIWQGNDEVYFNCTSGGLAQRGQVFRYRPSPQEGTAGEEANPGTLELYLEPNNALLLESIDNLTITPWGDLLLCEDSAAPPNAVTNFGNFNYLRGVTSGGRIYTFARNRYPGGSELAGACFSPDGSTMFVNIQASGLTLAVSGPWETVRRA